MAQVAVSVEVKPAQTVCWEAETDTDIEALGSIPIVTVVSPAQPKESTPVTVYVALVVGLATAVALLGGCGSRVPEDEVIVCDQL